MAMGTPHPVVEVRRCLWTVAALAVVVLGGLTVRSTSLQPSPSFFDTLLTDLLQVPMQKDPPLGSLLSHLPAFTNAPLPKDFAKGKSIVLVIDRCTPCLLPELQGWATALASAGLPPMVLVTKNDVASVQKVLVEKDITADILSDPQGAMAANLNAFFTPRAYAFEKGRLVWKQEVVDIAPERATGEILQVTGGWLRLAGWLRERKEIAEKGLTSSLALLSSFGHFVVLLGLLLCCLVLLRPTSLQGLQRRWWRRDAAFVLVLSLVFGPVLVGSEQGHVQQGQRLWKQGESSSSNRLSGSPLPSRSRQGNGWLQDVVWIRPTLTGASVAFSPDGQLLATIGVFETILIYRVSDGSVVRVLTGHTDYVTSVSFSPDGQLLASGSYDNTVKLWQVSDGTLVRTLTGHTDDVTSVSFSPDGQLLASGSWDGAVKLWRVSDGTLVRTLTGHTGSVSSVAFSPDGQFLASGRDDIKLWGVSDGSLVRTLTGHTVCGVCRFLFP